MTEELNPAAVKLITQFIAGKIMPFEDLLEDSSVLLDEGIYNSISYLCHDACHDLSIVLADAFEYDSILMLTDNMGIPVHSGLYLESRSLILDGNGIHCANDALAHWKHIGYASAMKTVKIEDLAFFSDPDDFQCEIVVSHFNLIADYVENNELLLPCSKTFTPDDFSLG